MLAGKQRVDVGAQKEAFSANLNRPLPKLHSVNVGGEIKSFKVGKDDKGPYAEITFTEQTIAEFESRPFIATEPSVGLEKVAKDLSTRLKDFVLDLMGNGFSFVSSLRPTFVKAIGKQTLRVGVDPAQLDVLSYYEKIYAEQAKAHGGEFSGALALFADYSSKKEERIFCKASFVVVLVLKILPPFGIRVRVFLGSTKARASGAHIEKTCLSIKTHLLTKSFL